MTFKLRKGPDGRLWLYYQDFQHAYYVQDGIWHFVGWDEIPPDINDLKKYPVVGCEESGVQTALDKEALEVGRAYLEKVMSDNASIEAQRKLKRACGDAKVALGKELRRG